MKKYFLATLVCFCVTVFAQANKSSSNKDPLKDYNKVIFSFNQFTDRFFLKPTANTYKEVVPDPIKKRFSNFFYNLDTFPVIANEVLQGKFEHAVSDTVRVTLNSTVGLFGLFDPASSVGFPRHEEDFGLTLAKWGWKDSSYFILPFWGPKTVRDAFSMPFDYFAFSAYPHFHPHRLQYELYAGRIVTRRAELLGVETAIEQASLDRYTFEKDAYLQRRNYLMNQK